MIYNILFWSSQKRRHCETIECVRNLDMGNIEQAARSTLTSVVDPTTPTAIKYFPVVDGKVVVIDTYS